MYEPFKAYGKTPRLFRDCVITEKLDGTNAQITIIPQSEIDDCTWANNEEFILAETEDLLVFAGSRNRLIKPGKQTDNYGFAGWVETNVEALIATLGPGRFYGEWWGQGIARKYDMDRKVFSLFNPALTEAVEASGIEQLDIVPTLWSGTFSTVSVELAVRQLAVNGSKASPGFMDPEGIITYHTASRQVYKTLIENDEIPKGLA